MEKEISTGAMLGVMLLTLAAVIGLGFGIFAIAKGVASQGSSNVQHQLHQVSNQIFIGYDQQVVTGTQAIAAMKSFAGKPDAVLISTTALEQGRAVASGTSRQNGVYFVQAQDGTGNTITFIDYNAVLAMPDGSTPIPVPTQAGGVTATSASASSDPQMTMSNGHYVTKSGISSDTNSNVVFDNQTAGLYKTGNAEYIQPDGSFQANLVETPDGTKVGIALRQVVNNG